MCGWCVSRSESGLLGRVIYDVPVQTSASDGETCSCNRCFQGEFLDRDCRNCDQQAGSDVGWNAARAVRFREKLVRLTVLGQLRVDESRGGRSAQSPDTREQDLFLFFVLQPQTLAVVGLGA